LRVFFTEVERLGFRGYYFFISYFLVYLVYFGGDYFLMFRGLTAELLSAEVEILAFGGALLGGIIGWLGF
jgi:hypothetical protein